MYSETCLERPLPSETTCRERSHIPGEESYTFHWNWTDHIFLAKSPTHFTETEPVTKDHGSWETTFLCPMGSLSTESFKTGSSVLPSEKHLGWAHFHEGCQRDQNQLTTVKMYHKRSLKLAVSWSHNVSSPGFVKYIPWGNGFFWYPSARDELLENRWST